MPFCETCLDWYPKEPHECPPQWLCWQSDLTPEDGGAVYASHPSVAVEKYAEREEAEWCQNLDGKVVCVRPADGGETCYFEIEAERRYSARQIRTATR